MSNRPKINSSKGNGFDIPLQTPAQNFIIWILAGMIYLSTLSLIGGVGVWRFFQYQSVLDSSRVSIVMVLLFGMLAIIAFTCILIIAFITHAGLIIHRQVIEILQLLGAKDKFIAHQFQNHTTKIALKGACIGSGCSAFTFILLNPSFRTLNWIPAVDSSFTKEVWFIIAFLPLLMILTVIVVTRLTVLLTLQENN